jgi:hypothetical protein
MSERKLGVVQSSWADRGYGFVHQLTKSSDGKTIRDPNERDVFFYISQVAKSVC